MGPAGTVTRLHYDAGGAHGWLGQVSGRKLFILFPPSDGPNLYALSGETRTQQSTIDPLSRDVIETHPDLAATHPRWCVVRPGEALLIPRGWWHYAAALDGSITVMRNFYHAQTNAQDMVQMVLQTLKAGKGGTKA